jgi:hypothetical protein
VLQLDKTVIPGEPKDVGRDPWFDRLTTLSQVDPSTKLRVDAEQSRSIEGESRKLEEDQIILDPGSHPSFVFAEASPDMPRDLAGMTICGTVSDRAGKAQAKEK